MTDMRRRFEQDVGPHLDAAYNLARWLARSAPDAEDVVQDALLLAFRNLDTRRGANTKAWLLAIVRNCFLSARRRDAPRSARTETLDAAVEAAPPAALISTDDPEREAIAAERALTLDAALRRLPAEFREVIILRELEGLSYREIAEVTAAPVGTVMSRLARARVALKVGGPGPLAGADDAVS
jgi:RNA polymerase sigma-70 factor, ECF subfamily